MFAQIFCVVIAALLCGSVLLFCFDELKNIEPETTKQEITHYYRPDMIDVNFTVTEYNSLNKGGEILNPVLWKPCFNNQIPTRIIK